MSTTLRRTLFAGGFVVAVVGAATGLEAVLGAQASQDSADPAAAAPAVAAADQSQGHDVARELSQAFRSAAGRAAPAVVYIQVQARQEVAANPFQFFFNERPAQPQEQRVLGSGSGFIFRADGYILTNNHVVEGAENVRVRMQDGREFTAEVTGRDPVTDVAVIKVDATDLPTVQVGDSDQMEVGDWVVALGFPLNISNSSSTATAGIVSAKGRNLRLLQSENPDAQPLEHFIQTDAAINRGNSGGPLIDLQGRVIGINSAIASQTGFYSGYGFAVPSNIAKRVADDLIRYGEYRRPRLGVTVGEVDPADVEVYKLKSLEGAEIVSVTEGSSADRAGIRIGDVVTALDGQKIVDSGQLTELLARNQPGDRVTLDLIRYGRALQVTAELGTFPSGTATPRAERPTEARGASVLGFTVTDLTPALARRLQTDAAGGAVVTEVDRFGPASGRLAPGLVIERLNGTEVANAAALEKAAEGVKPGDVVSLIVRLGDGSRQIVNYRIER